MAVLGAARRVAPGAQLTASAMDVEMAFWRAASEVFPSACRRGRFFRRRQCVYRKIEKLGFPTAYESDPDVRLHFVRAATFCARRRRTRSSLLTTPPRRSIS